MLKSVFFCTMSSLVPIACLLFLIGINEISYCHTECDGRDACKDDMRKVNANCISLELYRKKRCYLLVQL